jgi:hypothetical protein
VNAINGAVFTSLMGNGKTKVVKTYSAYEATSELGRESQGNAKVLCVWALPNICEDIGRTMRPTSHQEEKDER